MLHLGGMSHPQPDEGESWEPSIARYDQVALSV